jgi:curli biogenesis system outer membrane secretion channel CsgG
MARRSWTFAITAPVIGIALATQPLALRAQERPRVAVIPFDNPTPWWQEQLGPSAANQLTVQLVGTGAFTVLERTRVDDIYEEWYRQQSGPITSASAVEIGKQLGARYLITGEFTYFHINDRSVRIGPVRGHERRAESALTVRVIDVESGENPIGLEARGNVVVGRGVSLPDVDLLQSSPLDPRLADQALSPAIGDIVSQLIEQRDRLAGGGTGPVVATITGLGNDGSLYIDQGENAGMTPGRRFHVTRVVDAIRDRDGNVLDEVTERIGTIEVVRVLSQSAICRVVSGEADVGDRLDPADGA